MNYEERAKSWYDSALKENDDFIKFLLLYISLDVCVKSEFKHILNVKQNNKIKSDFYKKINPESIAELKRELDKDPHKNENPSGNDHWSGKLKSTDDFVGIIEFLVRARNNLFHGDKGLDVKRDQFIVKYGTMILQPLVEIFLTRKNN